MHGRSLPTRVIAAALILLAACRDVPTSVAPTQHTVPSDAPRLASAGQHLGEIPSFCTLGRLDPSAPSGWEVRRETLFFARAELHERGQTVLYEYRRGRPLHIASCRIPYTEAALRRVDRYFGVTQDGGADQFRARRGAITIQGCVSDGMCDLEPIVVSPPPADRPPPVDSGCQVNQNCTDPWGGGGWEGGGGGSGSTGGGGAYEEGPLAWAACVGAGLVTVGSGGLTYVALEEYYTASREYMYSRWHYQSYQNDLSLIAMQQAERNLNTMTINLAATAGITVGSLLGVVALCSPSVLFPTP